MDQNNNIDHSIIFWHTKISLKVNLFSWRLLCNCLPTTYNLIKRGVLQPNTNFCVGHCGHEEDINLFFFFFILRIL